MRFLLYFPLPLLLILGSFVVSIDAAPQSVFKPVSPWPPHKPRLKRSIDDSNSTADYDSLSLDQLTTMLEETKKVAENEKMEFDAASEAFRLKEEEVNKATEDYNEKKKAWDEFKDFNEWTSASKEAQKIIESINIPALTETSSKREAEFIFAEKNWKIAQEEFDDINELAEGKDVVKRLNDESTSLTQEIATQTQKVNSLNGIKTERDGELSALKNQEIVFNGIYEYNKCDDPQKATAEPCPDIIAQVNQIKHDMPLKVDAAATATQDHKVAEDKKKELESQMNRIDQRLVRLDEVKDKIQKSKEVAEINLGTFKSTKDREEKVFLQAKAALEKAKEAQEKAVAAKTDADQKLSSSSYPPDAATKESDANTAQDEAGRKKTKLEGELANLKSDRDEKEKQLNATNAKVAEMQRAETAKKSAVSTGGTDVVTIIVPIVVVIILGLLGAAAFMYLKRRKRLAQQRKGPPNSGSAAAAAPEADSQNPTTAASQKPPSDPAAAPQPGSTKSNDAAPPPAVAAAPATSETPAAPPAPPAPPPSP